MIDGWSALFLFLLLQGNQLVLPPAKRRDPKAMRDAIAIQCDLMRCDTMRYSGGRYRIPAAPARLASLSSYSRACTACTSRLVSYHVPPLHSPHLTSRTPPARASTCTLYSRCWPAHWPAAKARRNEWLVQEGARAIGRPTRERIAAADWLQPEPQQFPAVVSGFISFYRKLLTGGTSTKYVHGLMQVLYQYQYP